MLNRKGFFTVDKLTAERTIAKCEQDGWKIFRLSAQVSSRDQFFDAVRSALPLDPVLHSNRSWDALADSLWSGLDSTQDERILIVWPDSTRMKTQSPEDFSIATDILKELPDSLSDVGITAGPTKHLIVLQVA